MHFGNSGRNSNRNYLVAVLASQRRQVLSPDIAKIFQVLRLGLVAVLDPFHLLGAVLFNPVNLHENRHS